MRKRLWIWLPSEMHGVIAILVGLAAAIIATSCLRNIVYRMSYSRMELPEGWVIRDLRHGLASLEALSFFGNGQDVYVHSRGGVSRMLPNGRFETAKTMTARLRHGTKYLFCTDSKGQLWMASGHARDDGVMEVRSRRVVSRCEGFFASLAPAVGEAGGVWAGEAFAPVLWRIASRGGSVRIEAPSDAGRSIIALVDQTNEGLLVVASSSIYRYSGARFTAVELKEGPFVPIALGKSTPAVAVDAYERVWLWSGDRVLIIGGNAAVEYEDIHVAIDTERESILSAARDRRVNTGIWSTDGSYVFLRQHYLDHHGWSAVLPPEQAVALQVRHQWVDENEMLLLATVQGIAVLPVREVPLLPRITPL